MTDQKDRPASEALLKVSPLTEAAPGPAASPEQPLYTATVAVYPSRVAVTGGQAGERTKSRVFPIVATAAYYPRDVDAPPLLVLARKTRPTAIQEAQRWGKKWLHRTAALLIWVIFGSYVFASQGIVGRLLDAFAGPGAGREWEGIVLACLLAILTIATSFIGRKRAALAALYVLFFPGIACFVLLAQFFNLVSFAKLIFGTLGRFLLRGANWVLLLAACVAVNKAAQRWLVIGILAYLVVGALYIVVTNFIWVTNPLRTLTTVADWASRFWLGALAKDEEKLATLISEYDAAAGAARQARRGEILKLVENITTVMNGSHTVAEKTRHATGRVVLFYLFAARFLGALFLIVLVFGGIFRGIGKLMPAAFSGTAMSTFWDGFYYSVVTFFTVGDGSITPRLFLAQAAVVCEVIFAVMTLTILLLSFSTVSVDVAQENGRYIEGKAREHLARAHAILGAHWQLGKDTPKEFLERLKHEFDGCRVKR